MQSKGHVIIRIPTRSTKQIDPVSEFKAAEGPLVGGVMSFERGSWKVCLEHAM